LKFFSSNAPGILARDLEQNPFRDSLRVIELEDPSGRLTLWRERLDDCVANLKVVGPRMPSRIEQLYWLASVMFSTDDVVHLMRKG
jgi:hypothetical protein